MEEKNSRQLTIFISYGHDEFQEFAFLMENLLKKENHQVWIDHTNLKPGKEWDKQILEGFKKVKQAHQNGRILLVMTPHSVGRPSGYCLNELTYALDEHLDIIPLKLTNIVQPLSIYRYQYLDCQNCWNGMLNLEAAQSFFKRLNQIMLDDSLDKDGDFHFIQNELEPIEFYQDKIFNLFGSYHERPWIDHRVNQWIQDENSGKLLYITAGPGYGKSYFAAHLIQKSKDIIAFHICKRNDDDRSNLKRIIQTLAYQIQTQIPEYQNELMNILLQIDPNALPAEKLFTTLITEPLHNLQIAESNKFILIDALDEAFEDNGISMAYLLQQYCEELPSWLRIIVTTRPVNHIISFFSDFDCFNLEDDEYKSSNTSDLHLYIDEKLKAYVPSELLLKYEDARHTIVSHSKGAFLYIEAMCNGILQHKYDISEPEKFPTSLDKYYQNFFSNVFPKEKPQPTAISFAEVYPLLAVLFAAREPLTIQMLRDIMTNSVKETSHQYIFDLINSLGDFLRVDSQERVVAYHASIIDWLTDKRRNNNYYINLDDGHKILASLGYQGDFCDALRTYQIKHLPKHIINQIKAIDSLFNDKEYIQQLDVLEQVNKVVELYISNFHEVVKNYNTNPQQIQNCIFNSLLFANLLSKKYSMYLFDMNYYLKVKEWGFSEFLNRSDFKKLPLLLRARAISYYHVLEQFNTSTRLDISDILKKKIEDMPKEDLNTYANIFNMYGVANRICGNFKIADRCNRKSVRIFKLLKEPKAYHVVAANLARSLKMQKNFEECCDILKKGVEYALSLGVPENADSTFFYNLHVCNGPVSLYIEYCFDTGNTAEAAQYLKHMARFYEPHEEARKGRFYPLYLLNLTYLSFMEGRMSECRERLAKASLYPGRTAFQSKIEALLEIYDYQHGSHNAQALEKAMANCNKILQHHVNGYQWEKYADIYPIYQICAELLQRPYTYAADYPQQAFSSWQEYKYQRYKTLLKI